MLCKFKAIGCAKIRMLGVRISGSLSSMGKLAVHFAEIHNDKEMHLTAHYAA